MVKKYEDFFYMAGKVVENSEKLRNTMDETTRFKLIMKYTNSAIGEIIEKSKVSLDTAYRNAFTAMNSDKFREEIEKYVLTKDDSPLKKLLKKNARENDDIFQIEYGFAKLNSIM